MWMTKELCFRSILMRQEVNAEQLQSCLNENLIQGNVKNTQGFSLESCRSMLALMDVSFMSLVTVSHDVFCYEIP
ncbi:unnamed protein product [Oncorhynchus mykiss]|uniref:Uncharacterized protein n=1 Tax=Oncorhynchus mykiss TaxID=8022 RepID=A0A060YG20_ONCMY|nr:unnamed protein product [Oncorhynchus mykiss]